MSYRRPKVQNKKQKKIIEKEEINNNDQKEMNEINNNIEYNINDIIKAFEYFDIKKTGKIKKAELTKALSTFGDVMTEEEMFNIFREAGIKINTEEEIDYIKFINFWIGNDNE